MSVNTKQNFIYYISNEKYMIGDPECVSKSDRTFDISFYDLANNAQLLDVLGLYYMCGNYGVNYTFESRAKWFCGYISAFTTSETGRYNKLTKNPKVRLLVLDVDLFKKVNNVIKLN